MYIRRVSSVSSDSSASVETPDLAALMEVSFLAKVTATDVDVC